MCCSSIILSFYHVATSSIFRDLIYFSELLTDFYHFIMILHMYIFQDFSECSHADATNYEDNVE